MTAGSHDDLLLSFSRNTAYTTHVSIYQCEDSSSAGHMQVRKGCLKLAYLAHRKLSGVAAAPLRGSGEGGGGRTLTATPPLPLGAIDDWSAKVLRISKWEVVQTLALMKMSPSFQTEGGPLEGTLISIIKHYTRGL